MSKRAERKTPRKLLANYSNIQQQFHRIFRVLYHLSVYKRIRDSVPRPLTSPTSNAATRPTRTSQRDPSHEQARLPSQEAISETECHAQAPHRRTSNRKNR